MDTDQKLEQINSFSKGMNSDLSDILIDDSSYREAHNLRLVNSTKGTDIELQMILGTTLKENVESDTSIILSTNTISIPSKGGVVAYGIIVTVSSTNKFNIYRIDKTDKTISSPIKIVSCSVSTPFTYADTLLRYENQNLVKLYITTGITPILELNILNPTNNINPDITNNIITNIKDLYIYPQSQFKKPLFDGLTYGNLEGGLYQYSYQLYEKYGKQSEISPTTKLIPVVNNFSNSDGKNIIGVEEGKTSSCGIKIQIPYSDYSKILNRIKIYRIHYFRLGEPPIIECIHDYKIPDNFSTQNINIIDGGTKSISTLTIEEYNSISGIHIIPKYIDSKNDYLFAANIQEMNTFDFLDAFLNDNEDTFICKESYDTTDAWQKTIAIKWEFITKNLIADSNNQAMYIEDSKNTNITIDNPLIDFVNNGYITNDTSTTYNYSNPYISYCVPSLRRGETYRYGIVFYDKFGFSSAVHFLADIKTPTINSGSIYSNTFYRKITNAATNDSQLIVQPLGIKFTLSSAVTNQLINYGIVGYEIVRCGRTVDDITNLVQGVLSRPIQKHLYDPNQSESSTTYPLTPSGFLTTNNYWVGQYDSDYRNSKDGNNQYEADNIDNKGLFQFISPEIAYQKDTIYDILSSIYEPKLSLQSYIYPDQHNCYFDYKDDNIDNNYIYPSTTNLVLGVRKNNKTITNCTQWYLSNVYFQKVHTYHNDDDVYNYSCTTPQGNDYITNTGDLNNKRKYDEVSHRAYAYIKLYNRTTNIKYWKYDTSKTINQTMDSYTDVNLANNISFAINSIKKSNDYQWDEFVQKSSNTSSTETSTQYSYTCLFKNKSISINGKEYNNYVSSGVYTDDEVKNHVTGDKGLNVVDGDDRGNLMGPAGTCLLLALSKNDESCINNTTIVQSNDSALLGTYLCNISHTVTPYGGDSAEDKKLNTYNSYGNYSSLTTTNHSTLVFDGDCFIQPFEYVALHKYYSNWWSYPTPFSIIYSIPIETNINLAYTYGYEFSRNRNNDFTSNLQEKAADVNNLLQQDKDLYVYNSAYSSPEKNQVKVLVAENDLTYDNSINHNYHRCFHSKLKTNNENIDSWMKFYPTNFIDVDTRYGQLTDICTFHNKLLFWQENAFGTFDVNEKSVIQDSSNTMLILGNGGILTRYDYTLTTNGMHDTDMSKIYTDSSLYWWDKDRRQILKVGVQNSEILSISKYVQSYINRKSDSQINNHPTLSYDKQYDEIIFNIFSDEALSYNERYDTFEGLFDFYPNTLPLFFSDIRYYVNRNNTVTNIYQWNDSIDSKAILFGRNITPSLTYLVNKQYTNTKVFDNLEFAGYFYDNSKQDIKFNFLTNKNKNYINDKLSTSSSYQSSFTTQTVTDREYNYRMAIPRNNNESYGGRMRGKVLTCTMSSQSNSIDFSLWYITTKYRISWS